MEQNASVWCLVCVLRLPAKDPGYLNERHDTVILFRQRRECQLTSVKTFPISISLSNKECNCNIALCYTVQIAVLRSIPLKQKRLTWPDAS